MEGDTKTTTPIPTVATHLAEIERLFKWRYGACIQGHHLPFADLLNDLYVTLLANEKRNVFDPSRSSYAHYILVVARSVLDHYQTLAWNRRNARDPEAYDRQTGTALFDEDQAIERLTEYLQAEADLDPKGGALAMQLFPHFLAGRSIRDLSRIACRNGKYPGTARARRWLLHHAREYAATCKS